MENRAEKNNANLSSLIIMKHHPTIYLPGLLWSSGARVRL
jgi:hypothetical protein